MVRRWCRSDVAGEGRRMHRGRERQRTEAGAEISREIQRHKRHAKRGTEIHIQIDRQRKTDTDIVTQRQRETQRHS